MAHLPPDAAIFSPSVARLAASTAKDWSYVDSWLASKYNGRQPPSFERNPDTLKALLALASLNEAADENRDLLARAETDALQGIRALDEGMEDGGDSSINVSAFREQILGALEESLTREGRTSLVAMATSAVHLGIALPEPAQLGQAMLDLQVRNFSLEQATARVGVLQRYTDLELARLDRLLGEVNGDGYRPPVDLPRQNLDMQRKTKAMAKQLLEMRDKVSSLARAVGVPNPTIQQLRQEEERYLELLQVKRSLDQQVNEFEGLPPDTEQARQQLDMLRRELRSITDRRDAVFENLVERETPRKGR
ncbi:hypothetical protein M406DRAFT_262212 [Cryphonectria parasitica EP155]|uniref:HAUS augmin-like complex subunit 1 n=1 Tax=Cryphonectria parasitica (strain ATCC 38755 / EP155) TaxID=660469 RepID=A0A9P4XZF3_CRYP1|nr:uncharacterized protein M406DRAFT_262212 [Cryphonectria parasitica EP155]KAF3763741.1 hypothetical protein M406DRAFT_262212 [Cryphonectria parasitica EP155]